ncbi:DUF7218 family protein, partial [Salmonella enterica]|uniref:DUF7218 family protein n=1 Tax=Salmonella enterica TaxID=28901 RepID=UPI003F688B3F
MTDRTVSPVRSLWRFREWSRTMAKDHGAQIKDDGLYEELRKQGNSKEKAARIANAKANGSLDHKAT